MVKKKKNPVQKCRESLKNKKNTRKPKRLSTPEDCLFGLLAAFSLIFALFCFRGVEQIPVSSSPLAKAKNPSPFAKDVRKLVKGYPIEKMSQDIGKKDKKVVAFLVAIAKKESNWGLYSPKKNGRDCYNYWGYRGKENPTPSGYSCFSSRRQAVNVVSRRIKNLVAQKVDTPREMVLWKCGNACSHSVTRGEAKWVRDVEFYYKKIL